MDAGPARLITLPADAALDGTVSDDGLPNPPGATTSTWSVIGGPGPVTFQDATTEDTHASFTGVPSAYCTVPVAWTANCVGVGGGVGFGGAGVGVFAVVGSGVRGGAAVGVGEGVGVTVGSGDSVGEGSVMIAPVGSGEGASSFCLGAT